MAKLEEAKEFRKAIESVAREVIAQETKDCLRVYKAKVTSAPSGGVCSVQLVGDTTTLTIPYSSKASSVSVGAVVWVAVLFNDMRNAIVWETADFR